MNVFKCVVKGYFDLYSTEYQKHLKAVKFCLDHKLSYPKETSEFFRGKIDDGLSLEDIKPKYILEKIQNGFSVDIPFYKMSDNRVEIHVKDIPEATHTIIIHDD